MRVGKKIKRELFYTNISSYIFLLMQHAKDLFQSLQQFKDLFHIFFGNIICLNVVKHIVI